MIKKFLRTGLFATIGVIAAYVAVNAWMNNFHVVLPHELYRSGQLDAGDIAYYTKRYGLRSVVNLRGENAGDAWYDHEVQESKEAGITHIDFRMSAKTHAAARGGVETHRHHARCAEADADPLQWRREPDKPCRRSLFCSHQTCG